MTGYGDLYEMPACSSCGEELVVNVVKVRAFEVFCGNELCPEFVQSFWIERVRRGR